MKIVDFNKQQNNISYSTIEALEDMLKDAKEGKMQSFICIPLYSNMNMEIVYGGKIYDNYVSYMGMLSDFQIDFKKQYEEDFEWKR